MLETTNATQIDAPDLAIAEAPAPAPAPAVVQDPALTPDAEEELFREVMRQVLEAMDELDRYDSARSRVTTMGERRAEAESIARAKLAGRGVSGPDLDRMAESMANGVCEILAKEEAGRSAEAQPVAVPAENEHGPEPDPADDALHDALCAHLFKLVSAGEASAAEGGQFPPLHRFTALAELELRRRGYRPCRARVDVAHRAALEVLRPEPEEVALPPELEPEPAPPTLAELAEAIRMGKGQITAAITSLATATAEDEPAILARIDEMRGAVADLEALLPARPALPAKPETSAAPMRQLRVDAPATPRAPSLIVPAALLTTGMLLQAGAFVVLAMQARTNRAEAR